MNKRKVTVSDLSNAVFCEQKAVYEKRRPNFKPKFANNAERVTYQQQEKEQAKRIEQGDIIHANHEKYNAATPDKRCFIATSLYGQEAWQTELLRQYRDQQLLKSYLGRIFVGMYYKVSPLAVKVIERTPFLKKLAVILLDKIIGVRVK